jgi:hypothetical protein
MHSVSFLHWILGLEEYHAIKEWLDSPQGNKDIASFMEFCRLKNCGPIESLTDHFKGIK